MLDVVITKNILNSEQLTMCVGDVVGCCGGVNFLIKKVYVLLGGGGRLARCTCAYVRVCIIPPFQERANWVGGGEAGKVYMCIRTCMYYPTISGEGKFHCTVGLYASTSGIRDRTGCWLVCVSYLNRQVSRLYCIHTHNIHSLIASLYLFGQAILWHNEDVG